MSRITLDIPLNRVEGDLEIRVTIENNQIVEANSVGTLYRGFENMLRGRDPMDSLVITPRICGICSITHLTAAVKAIEDAQNITPPPQAVRMRNLSILAETVQSDLRQVFLMFLGDFAHDYYADRDFFAEAKEEYAPLTGKGTIEALRASKDIVKVIAIIGGQWPHTSHMVPGGICTIPSIIDMTLASNHIDNTIQWYEEKVLGMAIEKFAETIISAEQLASHVEQHPNTHLARFVHFCESVGLDKYGKTYDNFISYGAVDDPESPDKAKIRSGVILGGTDYQALDTGKIYEDLSHSWYERDEICQSPVTGVTQPDRGAEEGYSWSKAPRYEGLAAQTGPLAQALVDEEPLLTDLFRQQGDTAFVRELARLLRPGRHLKHLREQVHQVLKNFAELTYEAPDKLESGQGIGLTEAARGALGHWVEVKQGEIRNYQIVTPTAWNGSPKDSQNQPGPWENALLGLEVKDTDNPMEMGHVIRSFDPCLVCTVHALGDDGKKSKWRIGVF